MFYKNFHLKIVLLVFTIVSSIFLIFFLIFHYNLLFFPILIFFSIIYQIANLIFFIEKTNRDLKNFLESIRYSDFSISFKEKGMGKSFDELSKEFNNLISDFRKIRSKKEEHYFYLKNVVEHIEIAIISFRDDGKVEMINKASKNLFEIENLKNIRELEFFDKKLFDLIIEIKIGETKLLKILNKEDSLQLSIFATEFKIKEKKIKLISLKNIHFEMEEQEMESWKKLIRVLTHEIMNSIAPISSLTDTMSDMVEEIEEELKDNLTEDFDYEMIDDMKLALKTIQKRSKGLIHFVETYRNLTKIPEPNFKIFFVKDLFKNTYNLLEKSLKKNKILCKINISPKNLQITADEQLIEQVIINLLKNSIEALENKKKAEINLKAFVNKNGKINLQIIDNGMGIMNEVLDKIFIPFFTTKTKGSGIGLSLSKQIMRLHNGNIYANSSVNKGTNFTLNFN